MKQANGDTPRININSSNGRPVTPKKRDRPSSSSGRPSSRQGETLEQLEDRILSNIFRITLDSSNKHDTHGHNLQYLESSCKELEEQGDPINLSTGVLDQVILEAASNLSPRVTPLDYLLPCWKRVSKQYKALRKAGEEDPKLKVVKEARRLCMSYCIFAVTMPDMFGYVGPFYPESKGLFPLHKCILRLQPLGKLANAVLVGNLHLPTLSHHTF